MTSERKNEWILNEIVYLASSSHLSSFLHHVVGDVKLDVQEKLILLMTSKDFTALYRISILQHMELLDKKLVGLGPEISFHLVSTLSLLFDFLIFFDDISSNKRP